MNYRGRYKVFMSIGLTIILIVQLIVFIILRPDLLTSVGILFSIIVLLAFVAIYLLD